MSRFKSMKSATSPFSPLIHFARVFFSGPINREMRHLISTLQTHNQQMKGEVVKYKIRLRETQAELSQVNLIERLLIMTTKKNQQQQSGRLEFFHVFRCVPQREVPSSRLSPVQRLK